MGVWMGHVDRGCGWACGRGCGWGMWIGGVDGACG